MKLPWGDRPWLPALWLAEGCVAVAALVTLARGGVPQDVLVTTAYLALCGAVLTLPGPALRAALIALAVAPQRRRLFLQLNLAFAAALVAAMLGTARGWAAVLAILLTGNALLTLEVESRVGARQEGG